MHAKKTSRWCAYGTTAHEACGCDEGSSVHAQNSGLGLAVFEHLDQSSRFLNAAAAPAMASSEGQAAPLVRNLVTVSAQSVDAKAVIARFTGGDGAKHGGLVPDYSVAASCRHSSPLYISSWRPSLSTTAQRVAPPASREGLPPHMGSGGARGRPSAKKTEDASAAAALECVCGGRRGDWREARFGSGWHDDCQAEEDTTAAPACSGGMCKVCQCAAGLTADCAAVCCCPLSVLHLLVLGCVKLPCIVVCKGLVSVKRKFRKRRRRSSVPRYERDDSLRQKSGLAIDFSAYTEPEPMSPKAGGFGDDAMWREYFGSDG